MSSYQTQAANFTLSPHTHSFLTSVGSWDFGGSLMADNLTHPYDQCRLLTIDDLPDDVLLEIFDFYVVGYQDLDFTEVLHRSQDTKKEIEPWKSLVQVCRRWRGLVLRSPRRLNLQICCTPSRSAGKSVDVWPTLPLLIDGRVTESSVNYVIAELKHSDRIRQIRLNCHITSQIEKIWTAMQVPLPELAVLWLSFEDSLYVPVVPNSFLDGSAPRLRFLALGAVPFPGLPKLLLSTTHLVHLFLANVPHSGYISPEAMATCLSTLTSLETLHLEFESPQSCPDWENRRSPPPTRSTLPALTFFSFEGANEYSEDLVSRIDAPRLYQLSATFFNDIDFDTPELGQFISRTPKFGAYDEARLIFHSHEARVRLQYPQFRPDRSQNGMVEVKILCQVPGWQLSFLTQICTMSLRLLLTMERLYIEEDEYSPPNWKDDIENTEWLDLLLPFTAVKNLYISTQILQRIAPALQEVTGGRSTEVLPALEKVLSEGFHSSKPVPEGFGKFISARQLTTCPVTTSIWHRLRSDFRFLAARHSSLPPHSFTEGNAAMKLQYPDDRFDWLRIPASRTRNEQVSGVICLDCPGKYYIPDAGMSNFEIHLKNRSHRRRVADRLKSAK